MSEALYKIVDEILRQDYTDKETGEIDMDKYDELNLSFEVKVDNTACLIKNLESDVSGIREEEQILSGRRKTKENQIKRLKGIIEYNLNRANITKFETARCMLSYLKSEAVMVDDESIIPMEYIRLKHEVNRSEIKAALSSGKEIPGCRLQEHQNLQIK